MTAPPPLTEGVEGSDVGATAAAGGRAAGVLLVAVSAVSFGTIAIFARMAYEAGGDPVAVLLLRFTVAAAVMAGLMLLRGEPWPRGRTLMALAALGGVCYVGQSLSFFTALTFASAGLVALLLYLYPAVVTVLAVAFLGERLTRTKLAALVLAVAGSALTIGPAGSGRLAGIVLGVLSALIYSVYITLGSAVTPRAGAIPSSTVIIASAAAVYGVLALAQRPAFPTGAQGAVAILGLGVVATVVAIVTFFAGMERIGPTDTSSLSSLEPAVTVALAAVVLGERVAPVQLAGGALILVAVVVLARAGDGGAPAATTRRQAHP